MNSKSQILYSIFKIAEILQVINGNICLMQGTATLNVVTGSIAVVVKHGEIIAHVDSISEDSFIELETGDIVVHVGTDFPFR